MTGLTVQNNYNAHGYLQSVANASSGLVYWQALSVSATGKILQEKQGNNVITNRSYDATGRITGISAVNASSVTLQNLSTTYDTIGNVTQRTDHVYGTENFTYDALNRLLSASGAPSQNVPAKTVTYDALGNITNKSDVGTYSYGTSSNGVIWRPHAVASVTGGASQSAATYDYDQNGSLIQRTYASGKHHTLEYTSFNRVKKVTGYYSGSLIEGTVEFIFNAEHQRVRQIRTKDGITTTTEYVHPDNQGGLLFERVTIGSSVTYKHYISGGSGTTAVVITGAENRTEYWHKDHLGSIVVLSDHNGTEISGSRRYVDAWGLYKPTGPSASGNRGYTGHEHIDFDIVHMNGRTYDPILARMMGADPYIQDPSNSQNFNRFTYCMNNPVICTDPSGHEFDIGSLIPMVVAAVVTWGVSTMVSGAIWTSIAAMGPPTVAQFAMMNIVAGAAGGFMGALVASEGNFGEALKGAITGGLFGAVGAEFKAGTLGSYAGHAAVGCLSGAMSGNGCGRGAISQLVSKGMTNAAVALEWDTAAQVIAATIAGGTASVIGGGNFANGAFTAAMGYLLNCLAHQPCAGRLPKDGEHGYLETRWVDGKAYIVRLNGLCADTNCIVTGANVDWSDSRSQAYAKAMNVQFASVVSDGAALVVLKTPLTTLGKGAEAAGLSADLAKAYMKQDKSELAPNALGQGIKVWAESVFHSVKGFAQRLGTLVEKTVDWALHSKKEGR